MLDNFKTFIKTGKRHHNGNVIHHAEEFKPMATKFVNEQVQIEQIRKEKSKKNIERYQIGEKLGEGAFSIVYQAIDKTTNQRVAVKVIKKYQLDEKQRSNVLKEVNIMKQLNHPNLVKLIDFIENDEYYYIIQELVSGGEIFNQIVKYTYFSEDLSRHIIIQVAEALIYLHQEKGIVHRDLKPENIFYKPIKIIPNSKNPLRNSDNPQTKKDEGKFIMNYGGGGIGLVKIGDFGLSKQLQLDTLDLKTPCGTVGYTAPEIVKDQRYSKEVDIWALGCVLYILLCGFPPFFNDNIEELTRAVAKGHFTFLSPWWDEISNGAKHCVSKLLTVDPKDRYTLRDLMNDPWIQEFLNKSQSSTQSPTQAQAQAQSQSQFQAQSQAQPLVNSSSSTPLEDLDTSYSDSIQDPMDFGEELHRTDHKALFTPAVIAMKEAMDITAATMRDRELNSSINKNVWKPDPPMNFSLHLDESSILARRRKVKT